MTTAEEREILVEKVLTAHRERDPRGGVKSSPAFHDLDDERRVEAFEEALSTRALEAALDAEGRSTTVKAVLAIIGGRRR